MRLAVVGGGITGLAAAWEAVTDGIDVTLHEAGDRFGGKLLTTPFAGHPVDAGADAFLARVPEGRDLCTELGIASTLVSPATGDAYVWRGRTPASHPRQRARRPDRRQRDGARRRAAAGR